MGGDGKSSFWVSAGSSLAGSLLGLTAILVLDNDVASTVIAAGMGAGTAELTGGVWWQGAAQAAALHLLNQVAHKNKNYHPAPKEVHGHPEVGEGKYNTGANDWYRNGNGEPLYIDLDKIDLANLTPSDFDKLEQQEAFNYCKEVLMA